MNEYSESYDAHSLYGMKAIYDDNKRHDNPQVNFIDALERGSKEYNYYQWNFQIVYNFLKQGKDTINKEDIKILGVVVTGDSSTLADLKGKSFIKASSLGVITDKY